MHTISGVSEGSFKNRGSRFLGFLQPVSSTAEVEAALRHYREAYADARHHCYAYRLGEQAYASDDGEPAHSAGSPILRRLQAHGLTQCVCVVVRYFGGVKLGVPGLIEAYGAAAEAAIEAAQAAGHRIPWVPTVLLEVRFPYELTSPVERWQHALSAEQVAAEYLQACRLQLRIPAKKLAEAQDSVPQGVKLNLLAEE